MIELLAVIGVLLVVACARADRLAKRRRRQAAAALETADRTELDADYDPLARERAHARAINQVRNGPLLHQGQEL